MRIGLGEQPNLSVAQRDQREKLILPMRHYGLADATAFLSWRNCNPMNFTIQSISNRKSK